MTFTPKALFAPNEVGVLCISSKPEALRLAHVIAEFDDAVESLPMEMLVLIHAELRRLHGEIESMRAERVSTEKELRRLHSVNQELVDALKNLLEDTQHAEHEDCNDGPCPVREARAALAKAGGQA